METAEIQSAAPWSAAVAAQVMRWLFTTPRDEIDFAIVRAQEPTAHELEWSIAADIVDCIRDRRPTIVDADSAALFLRAYSIAHQRVAAAPADPDATWPAPEPIADAVEPYVTWVRTASARQVQVAIDELHEHRIVAEAAHAEASRIRDGKTPAASLRVRDALSRAHRRVPRAA